mgnify:CR=1 FL=1
MQFAVPQFTDVEDKLIGPLTLKQFLLLLATGAVVLFFWSLFKFSILFFLFGLPTAALGVGLTFAKFNGRPLFGYVLPFVSFMTKPKVFVFHREEESIRLPETKVKKEEKAVVSQPPESEAAESRLKKLAYLLDQKTFEEKEIMQRTTR